MICFTLSSMAERTTPWSSSEAPGAAMKTGSLTNLSSSHQTCSSHVAKSTFTSWEFRCRGVLIIKHDVVFFGHLDTDYYLFTAAGP